MKKAIRMIFDVICIISIIILPLWVLEIIGTDHVIKKGGVE